MCTVTLIANNNTDFILTSNRDEAPGRNTFSPKIYNENGVRLLYPKDAVAGGTWIGVSEQKRAISLMNGGFKPHKQKSKYRKSRGVVVKDFLAAKNLSLELNTYNFIDIEPFTAVIVEWIDTLKFFTLVWDGENLHNIKEPLHPKIWSSSPLYSEEIHSKRIQWFSDFLAKSEKVSNKQMLRFHKTAGEGNSETNLVMDRIFVKTKSITQIVKRETTIEMYYEDLHTGKVFRTLFD